MIEVDNVQSSTRIELQQSSEEIREITYEKNNDTSDAADWRVHVRRHPFLALGAAVGVGFLVFGIVRKRPNPLERFADALQKLSTGNSSQGIIKTTLLGILAKSANDFMNSRLSPINDKSHKNREREPFH
jgi:hypothetical protein